MKVTITGGFVADGFSLISRDDYTFRIFNNGVFYASVGSHNLDPNVTVAGNVVTIAGVDVEYSTLYNFTITSVADGWESAPGAAFQHTTQDPPAPPGDNAYPKIANFTVNDTNPDRVYFDSSEEITGVSYAGFSINGKTLTGVSIQPASTTGHYFTVSQPFTYWEQGFAIDYDGGSDIVDGESNPLYTFTFRHIVNTIPEPTRSGSTYYVTTAGDNGNAGTSEGAAWRTLTYALTQISAGDAIYIKAGNYGNESMTLSVSGAVDNPIKIIGYKTTPNDITELYWTGYDDGAFDASEMPYFNSGNRASTIFMTTTGRNYFIIKNIQCEDYEQILQSTSGTGQVYERWLGNDIGDPEGYDVGMHTNGTHCHYLNCTMSNVTGVSLRNENNSLYALWSGNSTMCNQSSEVGSKASTDYYLGINGRYGVYKNNDVLRIGNLQHHGHGISLKENTMTGTNWVSYNLVEGGTVTNIKQAIDFKRNTSYNVIRGVTVLGDPDNTGALDGGVKYSDNAINNIIEFCYFDNFSDALIEMLDTFGDPTNLTFRGNICKNIPTIIGGSSISDGFNSSFNTYYNISNVGSNLNSSNTFTSDIFLDVTSNGSNAIFTYCNFWSGFTMPAGTGNISVDPQFVNTVDFKPQNVALNAGVAVLGSEYDSTGAERINPTMGAKEMI